MSFNWKDSLLENHKYKTVCSTLLGLCNSLKKKIIFHVKDMFFFILLWKQSSIYILWWSSHINQVK
jgi:hypothetical protein